MASMFSPTEMSNVTFTFVSTCASLVGTLSNVASALETLISSYASLAVSLSHIASALISTCAFLAGTWIILRSIAAALIPKQLRSYFYSFFHYLFTRPSSNLTLVIDQSSGMSGNVVYSAAELYLATKISPKTERLRLSKTKRQKKFAISVEKDEEIVDFFNGIQLKWRCNCIKPQENFSAEKKFFELSFKKRFKDEVLNDYIPHVLVSAKEIEEAKVVKIYKRDCTHGHDDCGIWSSNVLEHPATFDTIGLDPELKSMIIHDLERFVRRKEFYKNVGKAWKRGYLLYGPPGTGKSSLIAAMASYLKFDIYDLELASINSNSDLTNLLLSTTNRSIIVIEDIDCSVQAQDRINQHESGNRRLTLSGILNSIDGLSSSCVDERIIVFTAIHKDRLDPALLRPGRMDVHINLSYCTVNGFRVLASNYVDISYRDHPLFEEIERLIQSTEVTPAEVAEELMREEDADLALLGLVNFLKHKSKCDKIDEEDAKVVKIYKRDCTHGDDDCGIWGSNVLEHPATFDTIGLDPELKKMIIDDLQRFVRRREFYKKVGKAWKRGYLLYGPPGTGKSSLIAAMANYLKFDIYDLELASIYSNSDLKDILLSTTNRSILVIEDIDCSVQVQDRENQHESGNRRLTLSGMLNFIDGLWSSCGDERIIVFKTNHKESLDPALLRPGRMDMHIELSYCTVNGFRMLASKYLDSSHEDDSLFEEIESLIQSTKVTPAEVAEELMREERADLALEGLANFLKHKGSKRDKIDEEDDGMEEANSLKSDDENGLSGKHEDDKELID